MSILKKGTLKAEKEETEIGLALKTKTKLNDYTTWYTTLWGRNVAFEQGATDEGEMIYGIETVAAMEFNENWPAEIEVDGFWGGYSDGDATFQKDGIYGFNYEIFTYLNYNKDLYKTDSFKLYFATEFAAEFYAQGSDYKDAEEDYAEYWIQPNIGFKYKITEALSMEVQGIRFLEIWQMETEHLRTIMSGKQKLDLRFLSSRFPLQRNTINKNPIEDNYQNSKKTGV